MQILINNAEEMLLLGKKLALTPVKECVIYLQGPLGAGKTTLVRGILQGFGYTAAVKSPTYTLVEEYHLPVQTLFHWDMYRLQDSEELENIGIRDYMEQQAWWLIEWPEHVKDILPQADLLIEIVVINDKRQLTLNAKTKKGELFLQL